MDLPPSSYHDSLEELWDEEEEPEEIETVMKVFPSVYHQYFNEFSKVKAEKHPPHRTCDHHIKMEGSLPPFHQLNKEFTISPILSHFDPSLLTICSRNKNIHHKKVGLPKPLPIPNGPWICLSMDFITQLPLSNSFDSILVIVDRFSKMAIFTPTMSSIASLDLSHLFIKNISSKHGLPSSIQLKLSRDLSTTYHPEVDGQTGRVNQILEHYLWIDPQFDSAHITQDTPAGKLSTKIQSVQKDFKTELEVAINRFKRYADKSRESPPVFNPGDM
ncbi:hypothetical protein O181_106527, partial [Austropuccinia psidii MF-1]|nr:hypothetical protein [Austropuccinia psidii MF-1]